MVSLPGAGQSNTITNNLLLPGMLNLGNVANNYTSTAAVLTLTVSGGGTTLIGDATDASSNGTTALTYTGSGILDLSRATSASNYSGGFTLNGTGTVRITNQYAFGTGAANLQNGVLEVRSDTDLTVTNPVRWNANNDLSIRVGQLPGGTGVNGQYGGTITLGGITISVANAKTLTIAGIGGTTAASGKNVTLGGVTYGAGNFNNTISNALLTPSVVIIGDVVNSGTSGTQTLTISGAGNTILGNVSNGSGGGLAAINYTGTGFLDLSKTTSANTYTGGLTVGGGVVRATNTNSLGAGPVGLTAGTLELRSDTNLSFTNAVQWRADASVNITLGQLPGGTGNNGAVGTMFSLGALTITTASAKTLNVLGIGGSGANSGNSLTIGGVTFGAGNLNNTIGNNLNLPGRLNLGNITGAGTTGNVTLTLSGVGFTQVGDIANGSGGSKTAITYSGSGTLQIAGTAATDYSGGLLFTGTGTLRMIGAAGFGGATNTVSMTNGTLDVRGDGNVLINNAITFNPSSTTAININADQVSSGIYGNTVTFAGLSTLGSTARTLTTTSGSNYNINFSGGFSIPVTGWTLTNNATGIVNLGAVNYTGTTGNALTISGSGTTKLGNVTGATNPPALTYSGTGLLDLTDNAGATNPISGLTMSGAGSFVRVRNGASLGASSGTVTVSTTGTASTLQVRNDNGGTSSGTIAFGQNIALTGSGTLLIIDVGNAGGTATGNTAAFGALTNSSGANIGTLTVNNFNGYGVSFTSLTLPSSTGQTTTLVANAPVSILGNVTNAMASFASTNFDTLVLDGTVGGTIAGTINDAVGGSIAAGGTTRIQKNGLGTWMLAGASSPYVGTTSIQAGTLRLGALNAIGTNSVTTINATGVGINAILDLNGNNQSLANVLTLTGSTTTSTPRISLGNGELTLSNATTALNYTVTNNPLAAVISNGGGTGKVLLGVANAVISVGRSTSNVVSASNPFAADVIVTAPVSDTGFGGLVKTGTGVLQLSSGSNTIAGAIDIQAGTLAIGTALPDNANAIKIGLTTVAGTLQWVGTSGGMSLSTRALTFNGTTGGGTLDNSGTSTGLNAISFNSISYGNTGAKTITLTGTNTDANTINALANNGASVTTLVKTGVGTWVLSNDNTYTGTTTVNDGTLRLTGRIISSNIIVNGAGAALNVRGTDRIASGPTLTLTAGKLVLGDGVSTPAFQTFTNGKLTATAAGRIVGGASNGGNVANNSVLTLDIPLNVTDTYGGLIGGTGLHENNINIVKTGLGTWQLTQDLSAWTGTGSGPLDPSRPTLTVSQGVLLLSSTAVINTAIILTGGSISDQGYTLGPNGSITIQGGLVAAGSPTDTFASVGITSVSHGVVAINIDNTGIVGYENSDVYLGAVGVRTYSGTSLAAGLGSTYRFGGGAPWASLELATYGGSGGYLRVTTADVVTGANNVLIGDDGRYFSGTGVVGGRSTVEFTAAQNFSGTLTIRGGTLQFTNTNQLGSSTAANSIVLDGGNGAILRWGPSTTSDISSRIGILTGGTIDTGANAVSFADAIGNIGVATGGLNKIGSGSLTLSKSNTYRGATTVSQGTVTLGFAVAGAVPSDILDPASSGIIFAGGTINISALGGATVNRQRVAATNIVSGTNVLGFSGASAFTSGGLNVDLGDLIRSAGSGLNIVAGTNSTLGAASGNLTTTSLNVNGILSGGITTSGTGITGTTWAVAGATQATNVAWDGTTGTGTNRILLAGYTDGGQVRFAAGSVPSGLSAGTVYYVVNSSASDFQVAATPGGAPITLADSGTTATVIKGGQITGLPAAAYLTTTAAGTTAANYLSTSNVDVTSTVVLGGAISINSLRYNTATTYTVTLTGTNTISSGGILIGSSVGNVATILTGGTLQTATGGDLIINQHNTQSNFALGSVIQDNGAATGLTKNGVGQLNITGIVNTYTGVTTINGGNVNLANGDMIVNTAGALGIHDGTAGNLVINGGTLIETSNTATRNFAGLFTIGLNGATIDNSLGTNRTWNFTNTGALGYQGFGARTFTLQGSSTGAATFSPIIGDNGGPTTFVKSGAGTWVLAGNNSYTGTTTINQGVLRISSSRAIPGAFGFGFNGTTTTTATSLNTGGGNLIFAATGTNTAYLELSSTSAGDFFRSLGTGKDQVQWTGNGGFSALGGTRVINLGGNATPSTIVWGAVGNSFVPTGNILQLTSGLSDSMIVWMNPLDLNGGARTIQVDNGTAPTDARITGALLGSSASSSLVKTGLGYLQLTADSSANAGTFTINQGTIVIDALNQLPQTSGRSVTLAAAGNIVVDGAADPTSLMARITLASAGSVLLDGSTTTATNTRGLTLDFSQFTGLSLGAYSFNGTNSGIPTYFSGTLIPNGTTYRLGSTAAAISGTALAVGSGGTATAMNHIILNRAQMLTGANSTLVVAGNGVGTRGGTQLIFTQWNDYGGTTPGTAPTTTLPTSADLDVALIVIANDSAFGAGNITFGTTAVNRATYGSIFGDHTIANNIDATAARSYFLSGNNASEGVPTSGIGATIFTGAITMYGAGIQFFQRSAAAPTLFLGDVSQSGGSPSALQTTGNGFVSMINSDKSFTRGLTVGDNVALVIDRDRSLGTVPATASTSLTLGGAANGFSQPSLWVQPGTGSLTLAATRNIALTAAKNIAIRVDSGNSLTVPGLFVTGGTSFIKTGAGSLFLQGANTANFGGIDHRAGNLVLDYANYTTGAVGGTSQVINNVPTLTIGVDATAAGVGGASLTLATKAGVTNVNATFGAVTLKGKSNAITIDNANGGTGTITLGSSWTFAAASLGGTLALTVPAGSNIATAYGTANTIFTDGQGNAVATFNGVDWAAKDSGNANIVAGSTIAGFYTVNTATAVSGNSDITSALTLSAVTSTSTSVRFNTAGALTANTGAAGNRWAMGGLLVTANVGANQITIAGSGALQGSGGTLKELIIVQNNPLGSINIQAPIVDNTAATALVKTGVGKLVLEYAANDYTGVTYLNHGVLEITSTGNGGASSTLGRSSNAAANLVFNGGTLRYNSSTAGSTDRGATINAYSAIDVADGALSMGSGAAITGSATTPGILQKIGSGTLTLGGLVTNTNLSIEVVAGTLNLAKTGGSGAVQQAQGAALIIGNNATARITTTFGNQIEDSSSVLVRTGGTFDLNGANETFDGLSGGGAVTNTAMGTSRVTLGFNHNSAQSANTLLAALAGATSTGLNNFSGVIRDGGAGMIMALLKTGSGTQILGGGNTYSGGTTINSGTLKASAANVLPSGAGKGDLILSATSYGGISSPGTFDLGGFNQAINGLIAAMPAAGQSYAIIVNTPGQNVTTDQTNTLEIGNGDAGGTFTGILQNGYAVVPGSVSGTSAARGYYGFLALTKVGTGLQVLSGANSATGVLTVNGGRLDLNTTDFNAWSGNVVVGTDGTLKLLQSNQILDTRTLTTSGVFDLNGQVETVQSLTLNGGSIIDASATSTLTTFSTLDLRAGTASARLAGTFGATKTTSGTVILSGANTYTGTTAINAGILHAGSVDGAGYGALGNGGDINFGGGTLQYSAASASVDYAPRIKNSTSAVSLDTNGQAVALGNVAATNTGGLIKSGSGSLTLTGTSYAYNGSTTVSGGNLNAVSGTVLPGSLVVAAGGAFSPGTNPAGVNQDGVGAASVSGDLDLQVGSTFYWEFNNAMGNTPGTDWDLVTLTGGGRVLTLGGLAHSLNLSISSWQTDNLAYGANNLDVDDRDGTMSWLFIDTGAGGSISGLTLDGNGHVTNFNIDSSQVAAVSPATPPYYGSFYVTTLNNDLYLNYAAVPEPGSLLLTGLAALGLAGYRRRKKPKTTQTTPTASTDAENITRPC